MRPSRARFSAESRSEATSYSTASITCPERLARARTVAQLSPRGGALVAASAGSFPPGEDDHDRDEDWCADISKEIGDRGETGKQGVEAILGASPQAPQAAWPSLPRDEIGSDCSKPSRPLSGQKAVGRGQKQRPDAGIL